MLLTAVVAGFFAKFPLDFEKIVKYERFCAIMLCFRRTELCLRDREKTVEIERPPNEDRVKSPCLPYSAIAFQQKLDVNE